MRSAAAVMTQRPVTTPTHVTVFRTIAPQLANGYRCYNRRAITSQSGQRGFATESLEHAIQLINKFIFEHEQRRQRQRAKRLEGNGVVEVEVQPISKPITFKASARTEKLVKEPAGPSPSPQSLSAYLALPLDQYSLLDPGWISRSPTTPDVFVMRIPLFDLVGLELQPQITVRVTMDPWNGQVHFHADQFKVGDERFDSDFKLAMQATLRNKPVPTLRPLRSIKRMWARAGKGHGKGAGDRTAGGPTTIAATGPSSSSVPPSWQPSAPEPEQHIQGAGESPTATDADEDIVVQVIDGDCEEESAHTNGSQDSVTSRSGRTGSTGTTTGQPFDGAAGSYSERTTVHEYGVYKPSGSVVDARMEVNAAAGYRTAHVIQGEKSTAGGAHHALSSLPECNLTERSVIDRRHESAPGSSRNAANSSSSRSGVSASSSSCSSDPSSSTSTGSSPSSLGIPGAYSNGSEGRWASGVVFSATAAATSADDGGGGRNRGGEAAVEVEQGSYTGPSHPAIAATSATASRAATSPAPAKFSAIAPSPSPPVGSPAVVDSAVGQLMETRKAACVENLTVAATAAVVASATMSSSPAAMLSDSDGLLPFIEDSVLYVPASQWGRSPPSRPMSSGTNRTTHATAASTKGGLWMSVAADAYTDCSATPPGPSQELLGSTASPSQERNRKVVEADRSRGVANYSGGGGCNAGYGSGGLPTVAAQGSTAAGTTSNDQAAATSATRPHRAGTSSAVAIPASSSNNGSSNSQPTLPAASGSYAAGVEATGTVVGPLVASARNTTEASGLGSTVASAVTAASLLPSGTVVTEHLPPPPLLSMQHERSSAPEPGPLTVTATAGGAAEEGATALLVGSVNVAVTVMIPAALTAVPRPLLGMTGSIIARYAIASLLPSFLDLLVADYGRWSTGQSVAARAAPVGDLAATAAANAAAMGASTPGAARSQQGQSPSLPGS